MLDSQLLERFVVGQDARAFRKLVDRHGPAVLRICRRLIHDPHEAEDAMQATFLILVQRAPNLRNPDQVDRWLAGVARRVAARARRRLVRRAERERVWATRRVEGQIEVEALAEAELCQLVREELGQMTEADYRPLRLCYLEGLTHEEAAGRLGCPVGTVKARLVRARRRLRDRLDRRGVALGLGLLLLLLRQSSSAAEAASLSSTTARLLDWAAAGDDEAIAALAPGAVALAQQWATPSSLIPRPWLVAAAIVLVVTGGLVGLGRLRANLEHARTQRVSTQLLSVLGVDCRTGL